MVPSDVMMLTAVAALVCVGAGEASRGVATKARATISAKKEATSLDACVFIITILSINVISFSSRRAPPENTSREGVPSFFPKIPTYLMKKRTNNPLFTSS